MGSKKTIKIPRVVLDTNCVLSALLFSTGGLSWLRVACMHGDFIPLVSHDTVVELMRVLNYPKFKLEKNEQETILSDFLPYAEVVNIDKLPGNVPSLREPDDSKFLALAIYGKAEALVSGDAHLLAAKSKLGEIRVLKAAEFAAWLEELD